MMLASLMSAMSYTRPAITYAGGKLSRLASNPSTEHLKQLCKLLIYFKVTMNMV